MKKIIFIDDDEINNFLLENKFNTHLPDVKAEFFDSAEAGLNYLSENGEAPPQFIFLDIKMPAMNGFDFLKEYHRRMYHESFPTRIFMLSSSVKASDREKSRSFSSVEGFISKPLEIKELQEIMEKTFK